MQSIEDHSAYLLNAKKGSSNRYEGIADTQSYEEQIAIIQNGGYCTFENYGKSLIALIKQYDLTRFDN